MNVYIAIFSTGECSIKFLRNYPSRACSVDSGDWFYVSQGEWASYHSAEAFAKEALLSRMLEVAESLTNERRKFL